MVGNAELVLAPPIDYAELMSVNRRLGMILKRLDSCTVGAQSKSSRAVG
jgi:hypothetical protein